MTDPGDPESWEEREASGVEVTVGEFPLSAYYGALRDVVVRLLPYGTPTRPGSQRSSHAVLRSALLVLALAVLSPLPAEAGKPEWGGSARGYWFHSFSGSIFEDNRNTALGNFRVTAGVPLGSRARFEAHGLLGFESPRGGDAIRVASALQTPYLPLQCEIGENFNAALDRLSLRLNLGRTQLVAGRQAITWGVMYFWPSMDLFSPFAAQSIDRDYKSGVDAVRFTVPLSSLSEIEFVGASLGPAPSDDAAAAALARFHLGRVDLGAMGGWFHGDGVAGLFLTGDVRGSGVRVEATVTHSGDPEDSLRNRSDFVRASVGFDRQLTSTLTITLEQSWNGYGSTSASDYRTLLLADRVARGEVTSLGKAHLGVSTSLQFHPLWTLESEILVNENDPSALLVPTLRWSAGNSTELMFGALLGIGPGARPQGELRSEYGTVPASLFIGLRTFF